MIHRHRPYLDLSDILAALRPGAGRGEFEAAVAGRVGARYAVAFAYGHAGAIASFRALGLTDVDVILPAYTCTVMADVVVATGNRPVFVDINLADYNMRLDAMKAALTPQTRAIIATHMYGYPTDVDAIRDVAGDERMLIIEDRAMGLLTFTPGTVGLRGDLGLFSFGPGKHLFTVHGGIIATNSAEFYEKIRAYRDREMAHLPTALWVKRWGRLLFNYMPSGKSTLHGLRKKIHSVTTPSRGPNASNSTPTLVEHDYATAYANFQARVGLSQLRKLDAILDRRQKLVEFYTRELCDIPELTPAPVVPGATYAHYTMRVERRDEIGFSQLMQARGIEVGQVYDHVLPFRERFRPYAKDRYPNTEQATREVVNLPIHPRLKAAEARYITECTRHILRVLDA
jgi:perosamine synthetase